MGGYRGVRGGGRGWLANDRPWTDHVSWGPMRGLKIDYKERGHINIHMDIATSRPKRQKGQFVEKFHTNSILYQASHSQCSAWSCVPFLWWGIPSWIFLCVLKGSLCTWWLRYEVFIWGNFETCVYANRYKSESIRPPKS